MVVIFDPRMTNIGKIASESLENNVDEITQERAKWNLKNVVKDIGDGLGFGTYGAHAIPTIYLRNPQFSYFYHRPSPWESMSSSFGNPMNGHNLIRKGVTASTTIGELILYAYLARKGIPAYYIPIVTNSAASVSYISKRIMEVISNFDRMISG